MSILYRIPEKVKKRLHLKTLPAEPTLSDPFLDWSVRIMTVRDVHEYTFEYILLVNGETNYATVLKNPGFSSVEELGKLAGQGLRAQFLHFGLRDVYNERIAPHVQDFRIAKACDSRVTAFVTALAHDAIYMLELGESVEDTCFKLNNSFRKSLFENEVRFCTHDDNIVLLFKSLNS